MIHALHRVTDFEVVGPHRLQIAFRDGLVREIDFWPILAGSLYGPLRDPNLFGQVRLDPEVHTLVWPNGADFDPATLHDWPDLLPAMEERARSWDSEGVPSQAMQRTRDEAKRCGGSGGREPLIAGDPRQQRGNPAIGLSRPERLDRHDGEWRAHYGR